MGGSGKAQRVGLTMRLIGDWLLWLDACNTGCAPLLHNFLSYACTKPFLADVGARPSMMNGQYRRPLD
jgi:hypothetical protein